MPNDDYIKRGELIEHFRNYNPNWGVIDKYAVLDDIRDFPAADVEPKRKTGVWLEEEAADDGDWWYTCSVCGYADIQSRSAQVPYCWHCGSRMEKETETT